MADYVDSGGPLPKALRDGFRMQRYGAPYAGGWMNWPVRWLLPVELALHTYEVLSSVADALGRLEGEALEKWQNRNERLLQQALDIQSIRESIEAADDGG